VTNMLPATVARLAELGNVVAIKEASGSLNQISEVIRLCPDDFVVLSGDDFTCMPTVLVGGKGVISVTSNIMPGEMAAMMEAALSGNTARANEIHYKLFGLMGTMFCYPSPAPAKKALQLMGTIESAEVRLPMTEMDTPSIDKLTAEMKTVGLL
ncbi:MAG: 4-hydroxy-tetrahydrodipicolinate synthase, partial [Desulfobulbus sp.]